jgi:methylmalonyl-CoA carboxyltransferase small subunit
VQLTLTIDSKKYVVDVEVVEGEEVRMPASFPEPTSTLRAQTAPVAAAPAAPAAPVADGLADDKVCRSPIAGVVFKINVEVGQKVAVDEQVAVLEAMKMETNITAHVAGTVKKVHVSPGEAVKNGQVLIEFE